MGLAEPEGPRVQKQAHGQAARARPPAVRPPAPAGRLLAGHDQERERPGPGRCEVLGVVVGGAKDRVVLDPCHEGLAQQPLGI